MDKTVIDIRKALVNKLRNEDFVIDKSNVKLVEIINVAFVADAPAIIGQPNEEYINREIDWYRNQSLNVNDISPPVPVIWKQVATDSGEINSNYGWCIFSKENGCQYKQARQELVFNKNSRRAIMIYNRPEMWQDYNRDGMSDFMCTNCVQYVIRDDKLHAMVYMRSNDVVFGYNNDFAWQNHVLGELLYDLRTLGYPNLSRGYIYWNAGSLHVYERHFEKLLNYCHECGEKLLPDSFCEFCALKYADSQKKIFMQTMREFADKYDGEYM